MTVDRETRTITLDADRPIAEQFDAPEVREAVEGFVRDAMGGGPAGSLWGEAAPAGPAEPIAFDVPRKDLAAALSRTQHALSTEDERPVLGAWWLSAEDDRITIHAADNVRIARARVDATVQSPGQFGIHRSDGKSILAFLAKGPDDLHVAVSGGAWSLSHAEGLLTGYLFHGQPPGWEQVTDTSDPAGTLHLAAKFVAEAAKAAGDGSSGVVRIEWAEAEGAAVRFRSPGLDEWIMPVRVPMERSE